MGSATAVTARQSKEIGRSDSSMSGSMCWRWKAIVAERKQRYQANMLDQQMIRRDSRGEENEQVLTR